MDFGGLGKSQPFPTLGEIARGANLSLYLAWWFPVRILFELSVLFFKIGILLNHYGHVWIDQFLIIRIIN